jgi:transcriptional regulator with XRE-family HTH domain
VVTLEDELVESSHREALVTTQTPTAFGRHLHLLRTQVFGLSIRDFAKRVELSPSYVNKLEHSDVGVPRRETVEQIAHRLGVEVDGLLLKAGYLPDTRQRSEDDEYLLLQIQTLSPEQRAAVRAYIGLVKDMDIRVGMISTQASAESAGEVRAEADITDSGDS